MEILLGHGEDLEPEAAKHRDIDVAASAVEVSKYDFSLSICKQRRLEKKSLETGDV